MGPTQLSLSIHRYWQGQRRPTRSLPIPHQWELWACNYKAQSSRDNDVWSITVHLVNKLDITYFANFCNLFWELRWRDFVDILYITRLHMTFMVQRNNLILKHRRPLDSPKDFRYLSSIAIWATWNTTNLFRMHFMNEALCQGLIFPFKLFDLPRNPILTLKYPI